MHGFTRDKKMRLWLSGPRILNGLVRPGISLGREDWNPRLPSYRRYELRKGLQAAAEGSGEPMSRDAVLPQAALIRPATLHSTSRERARRSSGK